MNQVASTNKAQFNITNRNALLADIMPRVFHGWQCVGFLHRSFCQETC